MLLVLLMHSRSEVAAVILKQHMIGIITAVILLELPTEEAGIQLIILIPFYFIIFEINIMLFSKRTVVPLSPI